MMETLDIKNNYVIERAQKARFSSNCLMPCSILNLCKLESGLMGKPLAKKQTVSVLNLKMVKIFLNF